MARILIVDDEHAICAILERALVRAGYDVEVAVTGEEGLEAYRRAPTDLVITDILLPEMDGLQLIRELRRDQPDLEIIAMSGGGKVEADSYLDSSLLFGAHRTIEKPFDIQGVVHLVDELMRGEARDALPSESPNSETQAASLALADQRTTGLARRGSRHDG